MLILLSSSFLAQNAIESLKHHRKYWYYKTRLNNDFVKVGTNDGESMPLELQPFTGQLMMSDNYLGKERSGLAIDFSNFPAGTYLLKFTTTRGTSKTEKIMVVYKKVCKGKNDF